MLLHVFPLDVFVPACLTDGKKGGGSLNMAHTGTGPFCYIALATTHIFTTYHTPTPTPYLAGWCLAELGNGLVKFRLLLRKVLLVKPEQLLAFFILLLQAWGTMG